MKYNIFTICVQISFCLQQPLGIPEKMNKVKNPKAIILASNRYPTFLAEFSIPSICTRECKIQADFYLD